MLCNVAWATIFSQCWSHPPLRHVPGYDEFKRGYGKSSHLHIFHNYNIGRGRSINLILDSTCRTLERNGRLNEIQLRDILGYYCCPHVVYCPFTCGDKMFFKKAESREAGRSIYRLPCPFNDGGSAKASEVNVGNSGESKELLRVTWSSYYLHPNAVLKHFTTSEISNNMRGFFVVKLMLIFYKLAAKQASA